MKVFIENKAGSREKNIFNEKTLEYKKTHTVSAPYPFPYGFIFNTTSEDGDSLDCFILTNQPLKSRDIVEVEPIGMFEQIEDGKEDHKILACIKGESWIIDQQTKTIFENFIKTVFSHLPNKTISIERFLEEKDARKLIDNSKDTSDPRASN